MNPTKQNTMEAIYLQSMTDFITWVDEKRNGNGGHYDIIIRYKNFLKQPLQLGFFVPCDENGNVLSEPKEDDFLYHDKTLNHVDFSAELEQYEKAKERVLFKDFYIENFKSSSYKFSKITSDKVTVAFWNEISLWAMENKFKNIESLASCKLELTPTAIKQIGFA